MGSLVEAFLTAFMKYWIEGLSDILDDTINGIVDVAFNADRYMVNLLGGGSGFSAVFDIVQKFGIALITMMFLKKGFDTYVAWTDDPDTDPLDLIINYLKAMIIALSFSYLYTLMTDVVNDLTSRVMTAVFSTDGFSAANMKAMLMNGTDGTTLVLNIVSVLILLICYIVLYIQFLVRGLEILILRIGMPIACCGLINNNKGVFAPYFTKLIQAIVSVFVQVVLWKMSFAFALSSHYIWAIASIALSIKTPKFLNEFIAPTASGIGATARSAATAAYTYRMIKR